MFELHFFTFSWGRRRGSIIFLIYDLCVRVGGGGGGGGSVKVFFSLLPHPP